MYSIYTIKLNKLFDYNIVVSDKILELGNFLISVIYLFFDKSKVNFVNNVTKVTINETYIYRCPHYKYKQSIDMLLSKLNSNLINNNLNLSNKNQNLCIIKTEKNKIFNSQHRTFTNDYNLFFFKKGFKIILVEELNVSELFYLIHNCKNLILSWGANSWCKKLL